MFENVDGRRTDAGVIGILIAHLGAFGPGELKLCKRRGVNIWSDSVKVFAVCCAHTRSESCEY